MTLIVDGTSGITFPAPIAISQGGTGQSTALIPSGTVMLFVQTASPTSWTKSTTHNDKALRIVSGTASSGGSVAFSTAFTSGLSAGATTLSTTQIPSHSHALPALNCGVGVIGTLAALGSFTATQTSSVGGGGSHTHTLPSFAVQYVDVIIATKD